MTGAAACSLAWLLVAVFFLVYDRFFGSGIFDGPIRIIQTVFVITGLGVINGVISCARSDQRATLIRDLDKVNFSAPGLS